MKDFLKECLMVDGQASSKRLFSFIAIIFFIIVFVSILLYLMFIQPLKVSSIERNFMQLLLFAGSITLVPQGLSSVEKFAKK